MRQWMRQREHRPMETADSAKRNRNFVTGLPSAPEAGNSKALTAQPTDRPES